MERFHCVFHYRAKVDHGTQNGDAETSSNTATLGNDVCRVTETSSNGQGLEMPINGS